MPFLVKSHYDPARGGHAPGELPRPGAQHLLQHGGGDARRHPDPRHLRRRGARAQGEVCMTDLEEALRHLGEGMAEMLSTVLQQGFVLPFRLVAVSVNGSFMVGEYTPNADGSGLDCETD